MDWPRLFDIRRWTRRRRDLLDEIDEEFAFHLERRTRDLMAEEGLDREEAAREARRRFGDREGFRSEGAQVLEGKRRAEARAGFVDGLAQDLKTAVRVSSRTPMVTGLALLALALGIGANSAVFSVVDAVLMPDLPYPAAERLVQVLETHPDQYDGRVPLTPGNFLAFRGQVDALEALEGYHFDGWTLEGMLHGVRTIAASDGFLELLGVQPALGRDLADDPPGWDAPVIRPLYENREVLLTHQFWMEQFGGDSAVVGRSVDMAHWSARNDPGGGMRSHEIVGVLPEEFALPVVEGFRGLRRQTLPDVVMPLSQGWWNPDLYGQWFFHSVGRLAPGATMAELRSQLEAVTARQREAHPDKQPELGVFTARLEELPRLRYGNVMLLLWGAVGVILAIACVNVACLLLARATTRQSEFAVRASLGAGRGRLIRQLFTESALLASVGGLMGLGLAWAGTRAGIALFPQAIPGLDEAGLNPTVVTVSLAAAVGTVFLFGWAPALLASRTDLAGFLKGIRGGRNRGEARLLKGLVLSEVALALILFSGAGLLTGSFLSLLRVDPGFDHERLLALRVTPADPGQSAYPRPRDELALQNRIVEALEAIPSVQSAAAIERAPLNLQARDSDFTLEDPGTGSQGGGPWVVADYRRVSQGYFRTMGIPVQLGRPFTEEDVWEGPESPRSVVVNESAARSWWPGEDPLGKVVYWGKQDLESGEIDHRYPPPVPLVVRGVVGDVKNAGLDVAPGFQVYRVTDQGPGRAMVYVVRTGGDPGALAGQARQAVSRVDSRELEVTSVLPMSASFDRAVAQPRFYAFLIGTLAATSLLMVLAGVYGVLAFLVSRRRHEMGVRKALGARAAALVRDILRQGMGPVLLGTGLGLVGVLVLGRIIESYLFRIEPHDPLILGAVVGLVLVLSLVAIWLPARRASRVDPVESLRVE